MKKSISFLLVLAMVMTMLQGVIFSVAAKETDAVIAAEKVWAASGSTVELKIDITKNPSILGATLTVSWDEALTLIADKNGAAFAGLTYQKPSRYQSSGTNFMWYGSDLEELLDGTILTLTFQVSEDVEDAAELPVNITCSGVYDVDQEPIGLTTVDGSVRIVNYLPGDVSGNDVIDTLDLVMLARYISDGCTTDPAGYNVTINESAADVNDDGRMDALDLIMISRYISDGCETDPNGYNIILKPSSPKCEHTMTAIPAKAATCTEAGNDAYWYCSKCGKYYQDTNGMNEITLEETVVEAKGHTIVIDPAMAPTKTETGLTEGSHCSVCNETIVKQETLPALTGYAVTYNIATGNSSTYVATKGLDATIDSDKRQYFSDEGLVELPELSLDGYQFLGWYNAPPENSNATQITEIPVGSVGNYTLYAHWYEYTYDITYKLYQTPLGEITNEKYLHYTVSKGLVDLPNPELYNYVFLGWYTDDGTEVTSIPVGTTGPITLNAYWTSKRNLTRAVKSLEDPFVVEDSDEGVIYFTYELGTIENVPLSDAIWTIQSVEGLAQQKSETVTTTISTEQAEAIAKTISDTTVDSASWTLSEDWNNVTEVSEQWAEQNGMTQEEANTVTKSKSNTYSFTSSNGGTNTTTDTDGTTTVDYNSQNYTHGNSAEFDIKVGGSYSLEKTLSLGISGKADLSGGDIGGEFGAKRTSKFEVSAEIGAGYKQHQETNEHTGTDTTTVDTTVQSDATTWNNSSSSSSTQAASESTSVRNALSQIITNTKGYGKSYSAGGENSESQGFSSTNSKSANSSSTLTYFNSETKTTTSTYSTDGKRDGCYRLVVAGTVHVFGVVGYDVATKSYFAYTYNVLDDKTYDFLDYSPDLNFDDYENGALPFEVPYFVYEYVNEKTSMSPGLAYRTNTTNKTATIVSYTAGTDTDVIIPSYVTSGGVAYKVTGLSASAFSGKNIRSVVLSDYITELPEGAFENCTQLEEVSGYFTKIGAKAFSGCTSLKKYNITAGVTEIGANAFANVDEIWISGLDAELAIEEAKKQHPEWDSETDSEKLLAAAQAITQNVIDSAINSGAQHVLLSLEKTIDTNGLMLSVPQIASFELHGGFEPEGGLRVYNGLRISSDAGSTTLKNLSVYNDTNIPLEISSKTLNLDAVTIESTGFVLLHKVDAPTITLTRDSRLISTKKQAVVWNNPTISSVIIDNAVGTLDVSGNIYIHGALYGADYIGITNGEIINIKEDEFKNYIKGVYSITFDANGGQVERDSISVFYGSPFGTLPTPTRDYYTFTGWYSQAEGGDQFTDATIMNYTTDITVYAHWTLNEVSDWVAASELPEGAELVTEEWRYTLTETTTSTDTTMEGWNQDSWEWKESGSGTYRYADYASQFDSNHSLYSKYNRSALTAYEYETTKRTVSGPVWYTYIYWHWCRGDDSLSLAHNRSIWHGWTPEYAVFDAFESSSGPSSSYYDSDSGLECCQFANADCCGDSYWYYHFNVYQQTYVDYQKWFTYSRQTEQTSETEISNGGNISNVQHMVQYRAK